MLQSIALLSTSNEKDHVVHRTANIDGEIEDDLNNHETLPMGKLFIEDSSATQLISDPATESNCSSFLFSCCRQQMDRVSNSSKTLKSSDFRDQTKDSVGAMHRDCSVFSCASAISITGSSSLTTSDSIDSPNAEHSISQHQIKNELEDKCSTIMQWEETSDSLSNLIGVNVVYLENQGQKVTSTFVSHVTFPEVGRVSILPFCSTPAKSPIEASSNSYSSFLASLFLSLHTIFPSLCQRFCSRRSLSSSQISDSGSNFPSERFDQYKRSILPIPILTTLMSLPVQSMMFTENTDRCTISLTFQPSQNHSQLLSIKLSSSSGHLTHNALVAALERHGVRRSESLRSHEHRRECGNSPEKCVNILVVGSSNDKRDISNDVTAVCLTKDGLSKTCKKEYGKDINDVKNQLIDTTEITQDNREFASVEDSSVSFLPNRPDNDGLKSVNMMSIGMGVGAVSVLSQRTATQFAQSVRRTGSVHSQKSDLSCLTFLRPMSVAAGKIHRRCPTKASSNRRFDLMSQRPPYIRSGLVTLPRKPFPSDNYDPNNRDDASIVSGSIMAKGNCGGVGSVASHSGERRRAIDLMNRLWKPMGHAAQEVLVNEWEKRERLERDEMLRDVWDRSDSIEFLEHHSTVVEPNRPKGLNGSLQTVEDLD